MMLYDVFYYDARTGHRLPEFDSCTRHTPDRALKGEVVHCVNVNWDGHSFWVDEKGKVWETEPPALKAVRAS